MKKLIFNLDNFKTDDADQICTELEAKLGCKLRATGTPGETIHGYIDTGSDGVIEVNLYEEEDQTKVQSVLSKAKRNISVAVHSEDIKSIQTKIEEFKNAKTLSKL